DRGAVRTSRRALCRLHLRPAPGAVPRVVEAGSAVALPRLVRLDRSPRRARIVLLALHAARCGALLRTGGDRDGSDRDGAARRRAPERTRRGAPRAHAVDPAARPFVLFVSTLEVRKNHRLLFQVWRRLLAAHGAERVPDLVFVGKRGWLVDD